MTQSIGQKPWMQTAAPVMAALEAKGGAGCARFVGGCVRNALLGASVDDVDIATTLTPDEVTAALQAAGIKAVPTGIEHGTVTAVSQGAPFEVTTLRRDVETDGRRAVVAFTTDWSEDAQRRDFNLNAVYADAEGTLYDPTGQGIADAQAGRIVFVGDPATRIAEDSLRILRFFRFSAWYGKGEPDAAAVAACTAGKGLMANLAAERVAKELLKLVGAYDPRPAMALMAQTGVLTQLLPSAVDLLAFNGLVEAETDQLFTNDPVLRLATLVPDDQIGAGKTAEALRLSGEQRERLIQAMGKTPRITSWMSPRESRRAVYQIGVATFSDRIKLAWARAGRTGATHQWRGLLALAESWTPPPFPLTGEDVINSGVPKGPMVGQVLREVEDWWIDHDFIDDKFSAIEKLKAVAQGDGLLKLGILETGAPPDGVRQKFGDYPSMFRRLFGEGAYDYAVFDVEAGGLPAKLETCDAYLVTGSSAGVYDPLPWIDPLQDFLRQARGQVPLVGVCFGHQIMAQAFGGQVIQSPKGWGVGLQRYRIGEARPWMDSEEPIAVPGSHQDQVVAPPPGAKVLGGNDFCPYGVLDYGPSRAISIQLHPEFEPAYAKVLIENRRGTRYTDAQADLAVMSYEQPDDRLRVGAWLKDFLSVA